MARALTQRLPLLALLLCVLLAATGCTPGPATGAPEPPISAAPTPSSSAATTSSVAPAAASSEVTATAIPASPEQAATREPLETRRPIVTAATTPASASGDRLEAAPSGTEAYDLLLEVANAQLEQPAWRATITTTQTAVVSTTIIEFVKPGSFRIVTGGDTEIIIVPDAGTFMKQGGRWQQSPLDLSSMMSGFMSQQDIEKTLKESRVRDLEFAGSETLGGKPVWVYTYTSSMNVAGTAADTGTKLWVGVETRLPYRYETNSQAGELTSTSVIDYQYDPSIKIVAPELDD